MRPLHRLALMPAVVIALILSGCASGVPGPLQQGVDAAGCTKGDHPVGSRFTITEGATTYSFTAGACFDTQAPVDTLLTKALPAPRLTQLRKLCEGMGLETELNKKLGHGYLQLEASPLSPDYGGTCAYLMDPAVVKKTPDGASTLGIAEVAFTLLWNRHDDTYGAATSDPVVPLKPVKGVGDEAAEADTVSANHQYILIAGTTTDGEVTAAQITTIFPPSMESLQREIDSGLGAWMNRALDATKQIVRDAPPDPNWGSGPP